MRRRLLAGAMLMLAVGCRRQLDAARDEAMGLLGEPVICGGTAGEGCGGARGNYLCMGVTTRRLVTCTGDRDVPCVVVLLTPTPAERP